MHATVFTDAGVAVDAVITRRVPQLLLPSASTTSSSLYAAHQRSTTPTSRSAVYQHRDTATGAVGYPGPLMGLGVDESGRVDSGELPVPRARTSAFVNRSPVKANLSVVRGPAAPSLPPRPRRTLQSISGCSTATTATTAFTLTMHTHPLGATRTISDIGDGLQADCCYECTATGRSIPQRFFAEMDVLPFGLRAPSEVFGTVGRHTNRGVVHSCTAGGLFRVLPYGGRGDDKKGERPLPLRLQAHRAPPVPGRPLGAQDSNRDSTRIDSACRRALERRSRSHGVLHCMYAFLSSAFEVQARLRSEVMVMLGVPSRQPPSTEGTDGVGEDGEEAKDGVDSTGSCATRITGATTTAAVKVISLLHSTAAGDADSTVGVVEAAAPAAAAAAPAAGNSESAGNGAALPSVVPPMASASSADDRTYRSARQQKGEATNRGDSHCGSWVSSSSCCAGSGAAGGERADDFATLPLWELRDLQLPPALGLHGPVPPLRVGARVVARRFGCATTLFKGTVVAAQYDLSYTIRYDTDGRVDVGVLHSDVHLLHPDDDDANDDNEGDAVVAESGSQPRRLLVEAEPCGVRDRVMVRLQQQVPAVIIEALGHQQYRVVLESDPSQVLEVSLHHIVHITPTPKEALYGEPGILHLFRSLDHSGSGTVAWKDVRHLLLSWEDYGLPLTFQQLGTIQRDMCVHSGRVEPQLLRTVAVQQEDLQLSYVEFEYVLLRALNRM